MITLFIIASIALLIWAIHTENKRSRILTTTLADNLRHSRSAFNRKKNWLIFSATPFALGLIVWLSCERYETIQYEYWLFGTHSGTREELTWSSWGAIWLMFFGFIIGLPNFFGFINRKKEVDCYEKMTDADFERVREKIRLQIQQEERHAKALKDFKSGYNIGMKIWELLN